MLGGYAHASTMAHARTWIWYVFIYIGCNVYKYMYRCSWTLLGYGLYLRYGKRKGWQEIFMFVDSSRNRDRRRVKTILGKMLCKVMLRKKNLICGLTLHQKIESWANESSIGTLVWPRHLNDIRQSDCGTACFDHVQGWAEWYEKQEWGWKFIP